VRRAFGGLLVMLTVACTEQTPTAPAHPTWTPSQVAADLLARATHTVVRNAPKRTTKSLLYVGP
jgi:hypothetical protein